MMNEPPMQIPDNPYQWVTQILNDAKNQIQLNPLAMILATADTNGRPSSRTVLLKHYDQDGFVFFTNSQSRKGRQMADNPFVSLTFYLPALKKQIQVEGVVRQIAAAESDAYWRTRPRESQISGWASAQSSKVPDSKDLAERYKEAEKKFHAELSIPRPAHWNGYRVVPERIEIWCEGEHRFHSRFSYQQNNGSWIVVRLFP